jgi:hypothetical protein
VKLAGRRRIKDKDPENEVTKNIFFPTLLRNIIHIEKGFVA